MTNLNAGFLLTSNGIFAIYHFIFDKICLLSAESDGSWCAVRQKIVALTDSMMEIHQNLAVNFLAARCRRRVEWALDHAEMFTFTIG
jgi:hypothetical protein